ncbi:MAG: DNA primase [Rhodothermales bacterium]|jgi:DNA primase
MLDDVRDRVKQGIDIVTLVGEYVPDLKKAGHDFKACCPFHGEKTPSFHVSPAKQMYYCFGCQSGGDAFKFVMEAEGVDFMGALRLLAHRVGVEVPDRPAPKNRRSIFADPVADSAAGRTPEPAHANKAERDILYEMHDKLAAWYRRNLEGAVGQKARDYLDGRKIPVNMRETFGLGYAPDSWDETLKWGQANGFTPEMMLAGGTLTAKEDNGRITRIYDRWRDRIMFPIWNERGRIVGFSGRVLSKEAPGGKYVNSPETPIFHKGSVLYGLHQAKDGIRSHGFALLCEGQLDVLACHEAGFDNAVAPQGTAFTEQQAMLVKRFCTQITLAFDADDAGLRAVLKSVDAFLPAELSARVVTLGEGEDPDSLVHGQGPEALKAKLEEARDFFLFLLESAIAGTDITSADGKARVANTFLDIVSRLKSAVSRAEYCQVLANRLKIPSDAVFQELRAITNRSSRRNAFRDASREQQQEVPKEHAAPMMETVAPANPLLESETILLDISLHQADYAHQLIDDLQSEHLTGSPAGRALAEVMAFTVAGEWSSALRGLRANVNEQEGVIKRILISPDYDKEQDPRNVSKAYSDCVRYIREFRLNERMARNKYQLQTAQTPEEKSALRREMMAIRKEKSELHRGL